MLLLKSEICRQSWPSDYSGWLEIRFPLGPTASNTDIFIIFFVIFYTISSWPLMQFYCLFFCFGITSCTFWPLTYLCIWLPLLRHLWSCLRYLSWKQTNQSHSIWPPSVSQSTNWKCTKSHENVWAIHVNKWHPDKRERRRNGRRTKTKETNNRNHMEIM